MALPEPARDRVAGLTLIRSLCDKAQDRATCSPQMAVPTLRAE